MNTQTLKCTFLLLAISLGIGSASAQIKNPLQEIERAYHIGEISIDEAVMRQLQILKPEPTTSHLLHTEYAEFVKCGSPLHMFVEANQSKLSAPVLAAYEQAFSTTSVSSAQSYVSPLGKFIINYETSGDDSVSIVDNNSNGVPDYVEWVAEASDSSYKHEILTLGFTDPIPDGEMYRVDILNLESYYGETRTRSSEPAKTYITIENDFEGFPPNTDPDGDQIGAVRATMAHEFKHAIQYKQSGNFSNACTTNWLEMDATLMEEVVYDEVNDYYNYIDGFGFDLFKSPSRSFTQGSYEHITWALYFHENIGNLFWTGVWERLEENKTTLKFMNAVHEEIDALEISFEESILENYMWHFASGLTRFNAGFGFGESSVYPNPQITSTFTSLTSASVDTTSISDFSARFYQANLDTPSSGFITINYEVSSSQVQIGLIAYKLDGTIETELITLQDEGVNKTHKNSWKWDELSQLGVIVVNTDQDSDEKFIFALGEDFTNTIEDPTTPGKIILSQNYPNPFNPETSIPVSLQQPQQVTLSVYDNLGRLVQTVYQGVLPAGETTLRFNSNGLPSGVYIYRLESDSGVQVKRMTVVK